MEVDTGASRSIMSKSKFTSIDPPRKAPALRPVSTDLRTYTKEVVTVVGSANVKGLSHLDVLASVGNV